MSALMRTSVCYIVSCIYSMSEIFTKAVNLSITLLIVLNYFNNSKKNINFATE